MPRPPVLPTIDWRKLFNEALPYADWLANAENRENAERMEQIRRGIALNPTTEALLQRLPRAVHVIAIAEDWCGDVVRHVPVLQRLTDAATNLDARYIAREQRPDVFVRFLTNGGEAIPKFIFLNSDFVECGNWGPMPTACRELISRGKACDDIGAARKKVSALYEADFDYRVVIAELVHLVETACAVAP